MRLFFNVPAPTRTHTLSLHDALPISERRASVRGISFPLQRRRQPPAPLDSRGLANCQMAAAACSWPGRPPSEESTFWPFALEDFRQPAAQSGACRNDAAVTAGLDGFVLGLVLDVIGNRNHSDAAPAWRD